MQQLVRFQGQPHAFGILDAKGDLVDRVVQVLAERPEEMPKPIIMDFTQVDPLPYGLLVPQKGESMERLVDRRMEVFDDVLGRDNQLSMRMSRMLRNVLLLAVEHKVALPLVEFFIGKSEISQALGSRSKNNRVSSYFRNEFERGCNTTAPALLARLDFLLRSEPLRQSFGSGQQVDLRTAMDQGVPILVSTGGPRLPRQLSQVIQSLVLSDLRQATFARKQVERPYTWFVDEAQTLMANPSDTGNLTDMLTMARSFGVGLVLMTQSIAGSSPDRAFLHQLETNTKWLTVFRCGSEDAGFIEAGLEPVGHVVRARESNGKPVYMTGAEEIREQLRQIACLPTHHAYTWIRNGGRPAARVRFPRVKLEGNLGAEIDRLRVDGDLVLRQLREQEDRLRQLAGAHGRQRARKSKRGLGDILGRLDDVLGAGHGRAQ
jgi:hypothetical protein